MDIKKHEYWKCKKAGCQANFTKDENGIRIAEERHNHPQINYVLFDGNTRINDSRKKEINLNNIKYRQVSVTFLLNRFCAIRALVDGHIFRILNKKDTYEHWRCQNRTCRCSFSKDDNGIRLSPDQHNHPKRPYRVQNGVIDFELSKAGRQENPERIKHGMTMGEVRIEVGRQLMSSVHS